MTSPLEVKAPDRSHSFAVLLGASTFAWDSGLPGLPAARRSLDTMERLLKSDLCGWTDDRMLVLADPISKHELLELLTSVLQVKTEQIADTVLFYYVGHGLLIDGGNELGFALHGTKQGPTRQKQTSLLLTEVRELMNLLTSATHVEILDCCYAGIATNSQGSHDLQIRVSHAVKDNSGKRYTLVAARRNEEALYRTEGDGLTYFTGYLSEIVTGGVEGAPAHLAMTRIFHELRERFRKLAITTINQSIPIPDSLDRSAVGDFPFARNAAYQAHKPVSGGMPAAEDDAPDHQGKRRRFSRRTLLALGAAVVTGIGVDRALSWPHSGAGRNSEPSGTARSSGAGESLRPPVATTIPQPTPSTPAPIRTPPPASITGADALTAPLTAFKATVESVAFNPSGTLLAGSGYDHTIRLFDVVNPATPAQVGPDLMGDTDNINAVAFSADGRTLVSGSWDKTIRLWNVVNPLSAKAIGPPVTGHTARVNTVAFSRTGELAASGGDDWTVRLWRVADPPTLSLACPPLRGHSNAVNTVAFSPDGTTVASAGWDGTIRLWDVSDPARAHAVGTTLPADATSIAHVAFSPDGKTLASAGWDNSVRLWAVGDPARAEEIGLPLTGHTDHLQAVAFSPDGRTLASAGRDKTIRLWDVSHPAQARAVGSPITGHTDVIGSVAFSPTGKFLASGSQDSTIRLWLLD